MISHNSFAAEEYPGVNGASRIYLDDQDRQEDYVIYRDFVQDFTGDYRFTSWLREELNRHNQTSQDLAQALKISKGTVSKWYNGSCLPSRENFILLLLYFNVSLEDAQKKLSRLGRHSKLYAKTPGDAAALLLLYLAQRENLPVGALLREIPLEAGQPPLPGPLYRRLVQTCCTWATQGPDGNQSVCQPAAPETKVLLADQLLSTQATPQNWLSHLETYCRDLCRYQRTQREKMLDYLNAWLADAPEGEMLVDQGVQWDGERVTDQLKNLPRRHTYPERDEVILWGLKLGMPCENIDQLLFAGGFTPLGLSDMDVQGQRYGLSGGLEGALKLALRALRNAFPSMFAHWPSAVKMIKAQFDGYEIARRNEAAFEQRMVQAGYLSKDFIPTREIPEDLPNLEAWWSIDGADLAKDYRDPAFSLQATVYLMLRGTHNRDGIKTFVRHVILGMNLPYEELPCWLTAPKTPA